MGRHRKFSPEQDINIARLYASGKPMSDIATVMGSERNAVRNSLLRSGVTIRPRSSPRPEHEWIMCTCGRRAAYRTGQCVRCYNTERNATTDTQLRKFGWWLMTHYQLTLAAYNALLKAQGGVCALCHQPDPRTSHRLAVDHDHSCCPGPDSCGKCVRGLLCLRCNRAVGLLKDDPATVARFLEYLTAH